ncbi:putative membrane protein [Thermosporothrix hazakensis]|jgi:uncharacterized membrane protein|uniref:DUF2306 domain-containing protein n=2 Tax=Thermosporothrix TaxID=768650 RepID=A0A455SH32_9CHLR|nr:DUF2306 domain-containing protein [Thermosporothrix hazakensis]PZW27921.1 putative membrane protein [Thermosporothrix hazakensis]BBH86850.1 hypothetical protein KTC_16010 [Thermosporothrix sp. COM3]GCE51146.1 hypothetical protein KTH_60150 [Thermosporothrix hazakensis]
MSVKKAGAWWWIIAIFAFIAASFLAEPYALFNPALSRLELNPAFPLHYPLLVAHVLLAAVAQIIGPFQFLNGLRARRPQLHRLLGRIYLLCILLGSISAVAIIIVSLSSFERRAGFAVLAILWLLSAGQAYRAIRQRRIQDHRTWMIRNYAITLVAAMARVMSVFSVLLLLPQRNTTFAGHFDLLLAQAMETGFWIALVLNILFAEWLILSRRKRLDRQQATEAREVA